MHTITIKTTAIETSAETETEFEALTLHVYLYMCWFASNMNPGEYVVAG